MEHVIIIAEAGVNHNGKIENALKLVDMAKEAGVDFVKFQTFHTEEVMCKDTPMAEYQIKNTERRITQYDMVKQLELSIDDFSKICNYCKKVGIGFLSTPFDLQSVKELDDFEMEYWKIPSGEITNYPLLVEIASKHKPIIMSTGMCEIWEIEQAIDVLRQNGSGVISLLQCNTEYPTPFSDVNLNAISYLQNRFGVNVGYSDHTLGYEITLAAVALGAKIIEKHITLDRTMTGPDHKISLESSELKQMVQCIRNIELAMGEKKKEVTESERKNIGIARKSIVAKKQINLGDTFTVENIHVKRPGNGLSPMKWNEVLGKKAIKDFMKDEQIIL